jgi:hypothetical protein
MNNKLTATAISLLLGMAAPFSFTGVAAAQETVTVSFESGETEILTFEEAAAVCGGEENIVDGACQATIAHDELEGFLDGLDDDEDDSGSSENSAKALAPGQRAQQEGGSAKDYAPGQVKEDGESAREHAPGRNK